LRTVTDKVIAGSITLTVVAFFGVALLYPLFFALHDAVHEPVYEMPRKDESWADMSQRVGVPVDQLKSQNGARASDEKPRAERPVIVGKQFTLRHITRMFDSEAVQWRWIVNSLVLAVVVTALCIALSYPLAWFQARTSFWQQGLLSGLLLLPLVMPPFVGAIGLRRLLSKYGTLNLTLMDLGLVDPAHPIDFLDQFRFAGVVVVMVLHFYPLIYLNLAAAISNIDPALLESSKSLGMTQWQTFRRVVLPLSVPGLIAGGSLVFIGAFTDLGTPLIFGYQEVVARQIFALANEQTNNPAAPALVAVVTLIVLLLFGVTRWFVGALTMGGVKGQTRAAPFQLSRRATVLVVALHVVVIGAALLPHISVVLAGLGDRWYGTALPSALTTRHLEEALSSPVAITGMRNSLLFSLASTLIDIALGMACAWVIVRKGGWWGRTLDLMSVAPLAIPGLVLAFGYVAAYGKIYSEPQMLFGYPFEVGVGVFLIMSYAIRRLPYTVRACAAGLEQTPRSLEEAAGGLGRTPAQVIRTVTLPLIFANVVAGGILAFSFAMLEVSDSLILATRPQNFPLTKAIYSLFGNPGNGDQLASALGIVALLFLSFSLLAAGAFLGKKWGQMFRG